MNSYLDENDNQEVYLYSISLFVRGNQRRERSSRLPNNRIPMKLLKISKLLKKRNLKEIFRWSKTRLPLILCSFICKIPKCLIQCKSVCRLLTIWSIAPFRKETTSLSKAIMLHVFLFWVNFWNNPDDGSLEVIIDDKRRRMLFKGEGFGELALLYNAPRSASIRALEDCQFWYLNRWTFRRTLEELNTHQFVDKRSFIDKISIFR